MQGFSHHHRQCGQLCTGRRPHREAQTQKSGCGGSVSCPEVDLVLLQHPPENSDRGVREFLHHDCILTQFGIFHEGRNSQNRALRYLSVVTKRDRSVEAKLQLMGTFQGPLGGSWRGATSELHTSILNSYHCVCKVSPTLSAP